MIAITRFTGSNQPQLSVFDLKGVIVASSYKRHASGLIEFWHVRERRQFKINESDFNKLYTTRCLS